MPVNLYHPLQKLTTGAPTEEGSNVYRWITGANGPTKPRCEALCTGLHGTGVLTAGTGRTGNTRNAGSSYVHKGGVKAFLKNPLQKKAEELLSLSRNQLRIMTRLLTGHCHLKGHLFQQRLVTSPRCDRCMQASETASQVLCDCKALATLRFRHLGCHFMKSGDYEDISVSRILHLVQGAGLLNS